MTDAFDPGAFDLILRVQQARMAHDADARPSEALTGYWIEVKRAVDGPPPTPRAGQWVISTPVDDIDALWAVIKAATATGQLGYKAKAATVSRHGGKNDCVICVRTVDADDAADVQRVLTALRDLGITRPLTYERDHEPSATP